MIPLDRPFGFIIPRLCSIFSLYLQILLALSCLSQVTNYYHMRHQVVWLQRNNGGVKSVSLFFFLLLLFYKVFVKICGNCQRVILELVCTVHYKLIDVWLCCLLVFIYSVCIAIYIHTSQICWVMSCILY